MEVACKSVCGALVNPSREAGIIYYKKYDTPYGGVICCDVMLDDESSMAQS
jgi:hypothetical protein